MTYLKPRTATVVIYQGDDLNTLAELKRAADIADRIVKQTVESGTARLGDDDSAQAERDAFDAYVDEAAERALTVEIRSIGRRRFRDLVLEHPARMVAKKVETTTVAGEATAVDGPEMVEHEDDEGYGVNTETFPMALLTYRDDATGAATIADPAFSSRADCERFLDDEVSEGDFDQLWVAAYMLNRSPSRDPKAVRFSTSLRLDETST